MGDKKITIHPPSPDDVEAPRGPIPTGTVGELTPRKRHNRESPAVANKMVEKGEIDRDDLHSSFRTLYYAGATESVACDILGVNKFEYNKLKARYLESSVESLGEIGVMGMVALAFDKLEESSRRLMQLIAGLDEKNPKERVDMLNSLKLLTDIETKKVQLLVQTGAIKVRKKIDIGMDLHSGGAGERLVSGKEAQTVMDKLVSVLSSAIDSGPMECGEIEIGGE